MPFGRSLLQRVLRLGGELLSIFLRSAAPLLSLAFFDWISLSEVIAEYLDFLICFMENLTMDLGGGRGASSSSRRPPLDLNLPPAPEPAPDDAELAAESEANAAECEIIIDQICERAKELAQEAGITDGDKLDKVQDAVKYLTDCDDLDEEARIPFLTDFLFNKIKKNQTWQEIDKEMKKWGGRGLC